MQCIGKRFGSGLSDFLALIRWQVFGFPLDFVEGFYPVTADTSKKRHNMPKDC